MQSPSRKRLAGALLSLAMLLCSLLMVEGVVRLRQWWLYGSFAHLEEVKQEKRELGLEMPRAGYATRTIRINSLGFRGPELTQPKPEHTFRLAFLGGSTAFCSEASSNETTWPHLVREGLQQRHPHLPMDYVNGGVTAYATRESLIQLQKLIAPLQPDGIVIYHATNDLTRETRALAERTGILHQPFVNSWAARHSLFWFLVEKNLQIRSVRDRRELLTAFPETFGAVFEEDLTRLVREAQRSARVVALITWSQQMRAEHTPEENQRAAASARFHMPFLSPEMLLEGFARYNAVIRRVAQQTGAILIGEENRIPGDPIHFNDSVHFTDAGSRVMAERVVSGLEADARWQRTLATARPPADR